MTAPSAVITINVDPNVDIGPLALTWHGIMIALGLALGAFVAMRYAKQMGLSTDRVSTALFVLVAAGLLGARLLYFILNSPGGLLRPGDWIGSNGYAIYGGLLCGGVAVAVYFRRHRLGLRYMDALAFGFPFGLAVGRVGCVINGEHYGPVSTLPWAIRHTNLNARVPSHVLAYHDGGFYELLLGLLLIAVVLGARRRLRTPGALLWLVLGFYGLGRFLMFFYRSDSASFGLGLNYAQLLSAGLIACALFGYWASRRTSRRHGSTPPALPDIAASG